MSQPIIVAIDDDTLLHPVIQHTFKPDHYQVHCVTTAQAGWRLVNEHQPAVVLLDLDLPDEHGSSLLKRIRTAAGLPQPRIVLFSGNDLDAAELAATDPDVVVVNKPFRPKELRQAVELMLQV